MLSHSEMINCKLGKGMTFISSTFNPEEIGWCNMISSNLISLL